MAKVIDYAGDLPLSECAQFLMDQAEDLLVLANQHEDTPSPASKEAVAEALDRVEGLLRGARRRLYKKGRST